MTFDRAFDLLMINEVNGLPNGGYTNNPADPGGETKYGISKRAYPNVDIAVLTEDDAKAIYERDYWQACQCDSMPWAIAWTLLDCAVNHGAFRAGVWLQRALSVQVDGILGQQTLAAIKAVSAPINVARDMTLMREDFAASLPAYATFKRGWRVRFHNTLIGAASWTA